MAPAVMKIILRTAPLLVLAAGLSFSQSGDPNQNASQTSSDQTGKHHKDKKSRSAGGEIGSGAGDLGKGAAGGAGNVAGGVAKGAGDVVTLHPIDGAAAVGTGAGKGAKDVGEGTAKGTGKIVKGIGKGIKHIF
jgi:hypothetical protein